MFQTQSGTSRLSQLLEQFITYGRSTLGEPQANAVPVKLIKEAPMPNQAKPKP